MTALFEHPVHGPYAHIEEAVADAWPVYAAFAHLHDPIEMIPTLEGLLLGTLRESHVELGLFDRQMARWLASWPPERVEAVIGWIERSHAAAVGALSAIAETGLSMTRCCGFECVQTAALPVGATYLCGLHGASENEIKEGTK